MNQHQDRAHALLSASGSSRWMSCTPSAKFEEQFPSEESEYAKEGTFAHELSELLISFKMGWLNEFRYKDKLRPFLSNAFYSAELRGYCDDYAAYVMEQFAVAQAVDKNAVLLLEQQFDLSEFIPEGFCTSDVTIYTYGYGHTIDLKFGKGLAVSAIDNSQMHIYSIGGLEEAEMIFPIKRWKQTIYQPRIENFSHNEVMAADLKAWASDVLKPAAAIAFAGEGEFAAGSHCRFCRAKAVCRANMLFNMEVAKYDFADANVLKPDEIADLLLRTPNFINWANSINEYALREAKKGMKWPGMKLVAGRSNRSYTDPAKVESVLVKEGYLKEEIYKPFEILNISTMEAVLSKNTFAELLSPLVMKAPGAPTLVPLSDKRPEYRSAASAAEDFAEAPAELSVPVTYPMSMAQWANKLGI